MSPVTDTDYDEYWVEAEPPGGGRQSRPPGLTWPVRLLAALVGVLALAVAGVVVFDLLSSPSPAAGRPPVETPAPAATATATATASPTATSTAKPKPKATVVAEGAPAPAGPVEISLARYLDDVGVTSDSNPDIGNLDGDGESFSAQALAASGARSGAVITYNGVPFRWPDAADGRADNVMAAGQALSVKGSGRTLAFLVTAGWGPARGTGKVVYANGSTQTFTIGSPDWGSSCPAPGGPGVAVFTPYHNAANGSACLYYASVQLQAGRTVTQIILPDVGSASPHDSVPSLHIFAITIN
jgi:hypothetical protein